jgi:hypothetical protein
MDLIIYDEDGFIAIVNADKYNSFVANDWQLDQIMNHFINEMNNDSILFWGTIPGGGLWRIKILENPSSRESFREIEKSILVTNGELYLTNYTDLTMAAQFEDCKIPDERNSDLKIVMENGRYNLLIRQMFDHENYNYKSDDNTYEIVIKPWDKKSTKIDEVYWWKK